MWQTEQYLHVTASTDFQPHNRNDIQLQRYLWKEPLEALITFMLSRIGEDSHLYLICFVAAKCVVTHVVTLCHAMLHGDSRNGHVKL